MSISQVVALQTQFFEYLYGEEEGYICIAYREPGNKDTFRQKFYQWPKHKEKMIDFIEDHKMEYDFWFGVNILSAETRQKPFCKSHNLLWADLDEALPTDIKLPPQVVLESSPGRYQAIWRLKEKIDPYAAEHFSKRIAYSANQNGADPSGWDLTQLLRVPFTFNFKYKQLKPLVKLIEASENLYDPETFELELPEIPQTEEEKLEESIPEDIPDAEHVIYKYQVELRRTDFASLWAIEPSATDDWSRLLWRLINICFEVDMSAQEVFSVVRESTVNKYARDGRPLRYLWRDVTKAELAHKRITAITGDNETGFRMPELISKAEIEALPETIIDEYRTWAEASTDAVAEYHDLSAMVLLSAILAPGVNLKASYETIVPNIWGLILGDSTLTRKSTAMGMAVSFLQELDPELILATDASVEGLLTGLSGRSKQSSIFFRDEVTGLFESFQRKDYMASMPEMLTQLYDAGKVYTRRLRKETISVTHPIFIFFGGGIRDKMYSLVTEEYIISGFMPRFLVVSGDADLKNLRRTGPALPASQEERTKLAVKFRDMNAIYNKIEDIVILGQTTQMPVVNECIFEPKAWERYAEIEGKLVEAAYDAVGSNLLLPTVERLSRSMLKMAVLLAAARQEPYEGTVQGKLGDMLQAAKYISKWAPHSVDLVLNSGTTVFQKTLDKIMGTIRKRPGISRSEIMRNYKLSKREMDEVQITLEERGMIVPKKEGRGYRFTAVI